MALVKVARPPHEIGRMAGEMDHVLAGSTADLDHVARPPSEVLSERRPARLVIAMEGRRIETAVRFDPPAVPAKFNDIFSQFMSPENEKADENATRAKRPRLCRLKPA
jgi:hypothetical protein